MTQYGDVQGRDLEGLVAASKLHSDRLAALEAELAELRAAEQDARQRHTTHIATIDPLKAKHAHHKVRFYPGGLWDGA